MPQLELLLIPTPGAKPEFLATLEPPASAKDWSLPPRIVLEGYTRDAWAVQPQKGLFQSIMLKSVDKRQKLGGFLKYLKDRQKAAYGRFGDAKNGILVIGSVQPPSKGTETSMMCRYSLTLSEVPNCPLVKKRPATAPPKPQPSAPPAKPQAKQATGGGGGGGLLGNLLGAQRRTNQHVLNSVPQKQQKPAPDATVTGTNPSAETNGSADSTHSNELSAGATTSTTKTGQQVLAEFRQQMEQEMLDFDISSEVSIKVPISLAKATVGLEGDEKAKVTMEVLKYIVYEQADEINEEWVAAKEPSEFMDEAAIAIYKEGHAPPEVLEDLNKGDLPDEIRGQQRAVQDAMRKQEEMKQAKVDAARMNQAHSEADDEDLATLNTRKRDRRTIEEIQRDMAQDNDEAKRQKTE